jgi:hypothetical protein
MIVFGLGDHVALPSRSRQGRVDMVSVAAPDDPPLITPDELRGRHGVEMVFIGASNELGAVDKPPRRFVDVPAVGLRRRSRSTSRSRGQSHLAHGTWSG